MLCDALSDALGLARIRLQSIVASLRRKTSILFQIKQNDIGAPSLGGFVLLWERIEVLEGSWRGLVTGEQLKQVEARMAELQEWAGKTLQQVEGGVEAEIDALRCRQRRETGVQLQRQPFNVL